MQKKKKTRTKHYNEKVEGRVKKKSTNVHVKQINSNDNVPLFTSLLNKNNQKALSLL